jgi:prepilin-type N-terminal cleavage/methylation domain-containing protein
MRTRTRRSQSGFSMVEALIAVALIGVVAIGVIPMFTRAMSDNMAGADYTRVTNFAKSKEEDFSRLPFNQPTIQPGVGQTDAMSTEYLDLTTLQWSQTAPSVLLGVWTRNIDVTQHGINDTDDDQTFNSKLAGGSSPQMIHIIQEKVQVQSVSSLGPVATRRTTTIRYLKAF